MTAATVEATPPPTASFIPSRLLTVEDMAELTQLSANGVRKWARQGILPQPIRLGHSSKVLRWDPDVIREWLADRHAALVDPAHLRANAAKARDALAAARREATAAR
jgi:predicted DNA-binding transcriptional regulator AlpA